MPRAATDKDGNKRAGGRHFLAPPLNPFSMGADTSSIDLWDSRPEEIVSVILRFLARGQAIMIGVSQDGGTVSIGVNTGEKQWSRKYAHDEGEWIGIWHEMHRFLESQGIGAKIDAK